MAALDPKGPSQPTVDQAYKAPGNPVDKAPAEKQAANGNAQTDTDVVERRVPREQSTDQSQATPSALNRGVHGAPPGEEAFGETEESIGRHNELDGEQTYMPGEGQVSDAVAKKPGAGGAEEDFADDLERKKAEQARAREDIKSQRQHNVNVGGALGQTGGPANPIDKDNYPNSGD